MNDLSVNLLENDHVFEKGCSFGKITNNFTNFMN